MVSAARSNFASRPFDPVKRVLLGGASAVVLAGLSSGAHAQDVISPGTDPEESVPTTTVPTSAASDPAAQGAPAEGEASAIVVTALKGNVSLQRAPVTVNIVGGAALEARAVTSVEQLTAAVPGVRINQAPGGTINPVLRGLGSSPSNNSFEQTVGLFVDGIFAGHPREYAGALFDIDHIELLKGTQSAVVGKNTSVGAISLITRKPTFEFGAEGSYLHEFVLGQDTVNAAINVPLSDVFAVRVAGIYSDEGGWVDNVLTGGDEPHVRRRGVRATVRFTPNDALDWTISGQYADFRLQGHYFHLGFDAFGNAAAAAARAGDTTFRIRRYETRWTPRPGYNYRGFTTSGQKNDGTKFNSTLNYDLGSVTLSSVTGYGEYTDEFLLDGATQILSPTLLGGFERDKAFSQELRASTDFDGPLNFVVGGYYYHDKWTYQNNFDFDASRFVPPLSGAFRNTYIQTTETISLFGQATYEPIEGLFLSGGLRYENFKKSGNYVDGRTILRPGLLTAAVYGAFAPFKLSNERNFVDYSAQIRYAFTPRINAYASFATGTKGFGYIANPTAPGGVVRDPFFDTEQSETYEAGVKTSFGSGNTFNIAVFQTRLKDYQIGVNLGTNFLIRNDQIQSRGVELNLDLQPIEGVRASVTATYADVKKRAPLPANSISSLPFAPKISGIADLSYTSPYSGGIRFVGNLTGEFRTKQHLSDLGNFVYPQSPGRIITDLRLAVQSERTKVEVAAIVRNLFDVYSVNYAYNSFGTPGGVQISEDRPRTMALQVSFKY